MIGEINTFKHFIIVTITRIYVSRKNYEDWRWRLLKDTHRYSATLSAVYSFIYIYTSYRINRICGILITINFYFFAYLRPIIASAMCCHASLSTAFLSPSLTPRGLIFYDSVTLPLSWTSS